MLAEKKYYSVSIPDELPAAILCERYLVNKNQTNRIIKLIDTWLLLKSLTTSGVIQNYSRQISDLLTYTQLTKPSFYNRIKELQQRELLEIKAGSIHLAGWKTLASMFDIDCKNFTQIKYDPHEGKKIYQLIAAVEINQAQNRQRETLILKVSKNPELKLTLEKILINAGANAKRLNDPVYYQQTLWQLQLDSFEWLVPGTERALFINAYRADVNRCVKTIQRAYKFKSPQSVSYLKKILSKAEIIQVEKQCTVSQVRARKEKCVHVRWLKEQKQTIWFACDNIIIQPMEIGQKERKTEQIKLAA